MEYIYNISMYVYDTEYTPVTYENTRIDAYRYSSFVLN